MAHTYTSPHSKDVTYYPSPVPRVLPDWIFDFEIGLVGGDREQMIGQLLQEVYAAGRGGQYRLATMGIRSVLEHVIITKVGDHQTFRKNLEQFYDAGYISLVQRDAVDARHRHHVSGGKVAEHFEKFAPVAVRAGDFLPVNFCATRAAKLLKLGGVCP